MVTDLRLARARSSSRIRASTGGASGRLVMCSAANTSAKPSKPSMITNRAPDMRPAPEHRVQAEYMEQRQHGQHHVVAVDDLEGRDAVQVTQQRAVAEHRGLRLAGRAGRVEQDGQRFRILRRAHRLRPPTSDNSSSPSAVRAI